jgi:hypothetical protein
VEPNPQNCSIRVIEGEEDKGKNKETSGVDFYRVFVGRTRETKGFVAFEQNCGSYCLIKLNLRFNIKTIYQSS